MQTPRTARLRLVIPRTLSLTLPLVTKNPATLTTMRTFGGPVEILAVWVKGCPPFFFRWSSFGMPAVPFSMPAIAHEGQRGRLDKVIAHVDLEIASLLALDY